MQGLQTGGVDSIVVGEKYVHPNKTPDTSHWLTFSVLGIFVRGGKRPGGEPLRCLTATEFLRIQLLPRARLPWRL